MSVAKRSGRFGLDDIAIISATYLVAFWLSGLVVPNHLDLFRPLWVPMVMIYWIIALPYRIGVYTAALVGVLFDLFLGTLMGQHTLALATIGYLAYLLHLRIRLFPIWQQCLSILILSLIYQAINRVIEGVTEEVIADIKYFLPSVMSACVWPWVYIVLRRIRRRFQLY